jgi:hypothetical protein
MPITRFGAIVPRPAPPRVGLHRDRARDHGLEFPRVQVQQGQEMSGRHGAYFR